MTRSTAAPLPWSAALPGHPRPTPATLLSPFWWLLGTLVCWHRRWVGREILRGFDDRQLRDVGLARSDVDAERRKPFWQC